MKEKWAKDYANEYTLGALFVIVVFILPVLVEGRFYMPAGVGSFYYYKQDNPVEYWTLIGMMFVIAGGLIYSGTLKAKSKSKKRISEGRGDETKENGEGPD